MDISEYIIRNNKKHIIFDFDDTIFCMEKAIPAWSRACTIVKQYNPELIGEFENSPVVNIQTYEQSYLNLWRTSTN